MLTGLMLAAAAAAAPISNDYGLEQNWLCRPDRRDACTISRDMTEVAPDGRLTVKKFEAATAPEADCFYVYPTVSFDETGNSDMVANDEERKVIEAQFARFGSQCRTFAPLYRSVTLTALRALMAGQPMEAGRELNYTDVRDAWNHYLANDNGGRPFVLIGHSQGTGLLKRLVAEGKDVGGDFKSTPLCRKAGQTGCVVTYVSFRQTAPPPAASRFGKTDKPGMEVACTNPARLEGGEAPLDAAFAAGPSWQMARDIGPWVKDATISTQYVGLPGLLAGQCVKKGGASYLAVSVNCDPVDPRTDDVPGDVSIGGTVLADWGLHLIDVTVAYDDLIALVPQQLASWKANRIKTKPVTITPASIYNLRMPV